MGAAEVVGTERVPATTAEVRAWLRKQGFQVGNRGHISNELIAKYNHRHHRRIYENKNPWTDRPA